MTVRSLGVSPEIADEWSVDRATRARRCNKWSICPYQVREDTLIRVLYELFRVWRWKRAGNSDIADDRCVAGNSTNLRELGERVYCCKECGYEGGSGLAEQQQAQRQRVWDSWTPRRRLRSAVSDLKQAPCFVERYHGLLSGNDKGTGPPEALPGSVDRVPVGRGRSCRESLGRRECRSVVGMTRFGEFSPSSKTQKCVLRSTP